MAVRDYGASPAGVAGQEGDSKTALGTEETVRWEHDWEAVRVAEWLRRSGFEIAAIETSQEAFTVFFRP